MMGVLSKRIVFTHSPFYQAIVYPNTVPQSFRREIGVADQKYELPF